MVARVFIVVGGGYTIEFGGRERKGSFQNFRSNFEFKNKNPSTKRMPSNNSILDGPIEEINVPILKPTRYVQRRGPPLRIERNFNGFADWMMNLVPRPMRRRVDRRIGRLRTEIENIYQRYHGIQLPHRTEAPLRGYLNTYRIDGQRGYDQTTFIQYARPKIMRLLEEMKRPLKMKLILTCRWEKIPLIFTLMQMYRQ